MTHDTRRHEDIVLGSLLRARAEATPDLPYLVFADEDDETWSWLETDRNANRAAHGLRSLGVERGDVVAVFLPNGPDYFRCLFGTTRLGAIIAGLNTAYRGAILEHALNVCGAKVLVTDSELLGRLDGLHLTDLRLVVVVDDVPPQRPTATGPSLELVERAVLVDQSTAAPEVGPIHLWDPYAIIFTSGTTGPSKGVLSPYGQLAATVSSGGIPPSTPEDTHLVDMPMFHVGGLMGTAIMLNAGGRLIVTHRYRASTYWQLCARYGITRSFMVAAMANMLLAQPESPFDREHPMRQAFVGGIINDVATWKRRFGIDEIWAMFNMTEVSAPMVRDGSSTDLASVGRVRPGVDVRIVDEHDQEVPEGEVGELIVRTDLPWEMNLGYYRMPEATVDAWRNGWFHTGDAFRSVGGEHYLVDRVKDCIRRRGENISSFEVEAAIAGHPSVAACAVVAVPSDLGEDEILAFVVPREGRTVEPVELVDHLDEALPYFMVPRYLEVVAELPTTPSNKVRKKELRDRGLSDRSWDRDVAYPRARVARP